MLSVSKIFTVFIFKVTGSPDRFIFCDLTVYICRGMFLIFLGAPPLLRIQIFLAFNAELGWLDNVTVVAYFCQLSLSKSGV